MLLTMTSVALIMVLFLVAVISVFTCGFWLGRDVRSKREFSRMPTDRQNYAHLRLSPINDVVGKP